MPASPKLAQPKCFGIDVTVSGSLGWFPDSSQRRHKSARLLQRVRCGSGSHWVKKRSAERENDHALGLVGGRRRD